MARSPNVEKHDEMAAEITNEDGNITSAAPIFSKLTNKLKKKNELNGNLSSPWEEAEEIDPPKTLHLERCNRCIVISNKFLNQHGKNKQDPLPGYQIDENNIKETFSSLNFKVTIKIDRTVGQIREIVRGTKLHDCSEEECLVLFILSHGTDDQKIFGANNGEIDIQKDILQKLESLNLPVLVFIQACRGIRYAPVVDDTVPDAYRASSPMAPRKVINSDMFVLHSTMPGDLSFVSSQRGSFFVNRLCAVLRQYNRPEMNRRFHLGDIVIKVNDLLSTYINQKDKREIGQVSQAVSSLTKQIFFQPLGCYDNQVS